MIEQPLSVEFRSGVYSCKNCNLNLFSSEDKFVAKNNYPSFRAPIKDNLFVMREDEYGINNLFCSNCYQEIGGLYFDAPEAGDESPSKGNTRYLSLSDSITFTPSDPNQVSQVPEEHSEYKLKIVSEQHVPYDYNLVKTVSTPVPTLKIKKKKKAAITTSHKKRYNSVYVITGAIMSLGFLGTVGYYLWRRNK